MRFLQAAFIRKNTPELHKKLEELGYKDSSTVQDSYTAIYTDEEEGEFFTQYLSNITDDEIAVDCGTNEDLFLAIAALRDDTSANQWFIMDVEIYVDIPKGNWFQSTDRNGGRCIGTQIESLYCHKATVEELIEHFGRKEK